MKPLAILSVVFAVSIGLHANAAPSQCRIGQLSLRPANGVSPATGAHPISLRLANRGEACVLRGYPVVVLRDARGVIPFVYRHGGDAMVTSRPPTRVTLRRGASAYVLLDKFRCDLGARRTTTAVEIGLGGTPALSRSVPLVAMQVSLCKPGISSEGRVVDVSPFESTLRATLRG